MSTLITKVSVPEFDGGEKSTPVIVNLMGRPTELHQIVPPPHKVGTPEPLKLKLSETYPSLIFRMTFHLQESDNLACDSQLTSLFSMRRPYESHRLRAPFCAVYALSAGQHGWILRVTSHPLPQNTTWLRSPRHPCGTFGLHGDSTAY